MTIGQLVERHITYAELFVAKHEPPTLPKLFEKCGNTGEQSIKAKDFLHLHIAFYTVVL
jgi:hypothetical protein